MSHWHFCHVCLSFRGQPTSRAAGIGQKADRELLHSVQAYFHLASKLPQPSESPVRLFSYNLSTPSVSSGCPTLGLLIIATAFLFSTPQRGVSGSRSVAQVSHQPSASVMCLPPTSAGAEATYIVTYIVSYLYSGSNLYYWGVNPLHLQGLASNMVSMDRSFPGHMWQRSERSLDRVDPWRIAKGGEGGREGRRDRGMEGGREEIRPPPESLCTLYVLQQGVM